MAETHQSAMGPYATVAAAGSALYAWTAVCREALVAKVFWAVQVTSGGLGEGGGGDGDGGGGEGGMEEDDGGGGDGDGGGGDGDGGGGDGGGGLGEGGEGERSGGSMGEHAASERQEL